MNPAVLLHGDYWPGNTLWQRGTLVCVIDWEDAVLGDPLADVANARMELTMAFGPTAAADFTDQYRALVPALDLTALPHWDLYAALATRGADDRAGACRRPTWRGCGRATVSSRQQALAQFPSGGPSVQNDLVPDTNGRSALGRREDESDP